jgi:hypothetical protein
VNIDLALARRTGNRPSHSMHSSIDGHYAYDVHCCAMLSFYQMFRVCLSRDHVHYPSMNMRNQRTFSSTDPLDLQPSKTIVEASLKGESRSINYLRHKHNINYVWQ